ncbi:MAG: transposase, partial [Spirochaetota bacterium]
NSADKERYGNITKRGSQELRTAFVQMAIGMIRVKSEQENRYMKSYRNMKKIKGSGKAIIATSRKLSKLVWVLLKNGDEYDPAKTNDILSDKDYIVA